MPFRLGCDIVSIPRFRERLAEGGEGFLERVFQPHEQAGAPLERLAGLFAAKEAACKALSLPPGSWLQIGVTEEITGIPRIQLLEPQPELQALYVSISQEGDYAMAVAIATFA
jgi:phosphopantetheine--protein transferase-like protein